VAGKRMCDDCHAVYIKRERERERHRSKRPYYT
jgi:hypothetical protein